MQHCPPAFEFPALAIGWGDLHFVFAWNNTNVTATSAVSVCYNEARCATARVPTRFTKLSDPSTILACEPAAHDFDIRSWLKHAGELRLRLQQQCSLAVDLERDPCPNSTHFRCGKKCRSKHRLAARHSPCGGDEIVARLNESCFLGQKHRVRCLRNYGINVTLFECLPVADNEAIELRTCETHKKLPHFPSLCNGYEQHRELINEELETDETHCEAWLCANQYTRCNGIWECPNGEDEIDCFHPICAGMLGYPCFERQSSNYTCLPAARLADGIIDCVGATDEQQVCAAWNNGVSGIQCFVNHTDHQPLANE